MLFCSIVVPCFKNKRLWALFPWPIFMRGHSKEGTDLYIFSSWLGYLCIEIYYALSTTKATNFSKEISSHIFVCTILINWNEYQRAHKCPTHFMPIPFNCFISFTFQFFYCSVFPWKFYLLFLLSTAKRFVIFYF